MDMGRAPFRAIDLWRAWEIISALDSTSEENLGRDHNARHGSDPGAVFYDFISDRFASFYSKVIPAVFVRNTLQIAVPSDNPAQITSLADLATLEVKVALCEPQVPCGSAAQTALTDAGVAVTPVTLEQDVKAVLTKVRLGEVDAGLVYRTDVISAGSEVLGIDFPEAQQAINDYPIVVLSDAPNPEAAAAFVELVRSREGLAVLTKAGFAEP